MVERRGFLSAVVGFFTLGFYQPKEFDPLKMKVVVDQGPAITHPDLLKQPPIVVDDPGVTQDPDEIREYFDRVERYLALNGITSTILPILLLVFPFTCFGETKVERDQAWEVGDRPVVVATSLLGLDEMNSAFRAEDQRQLQLLHDQGEILKLRKGDVLQVFHVHLGKGKDRKGNKHPDYVECTLLRGNRKIRKVFVYRTIMVVFCKQVN